MTYNNPVKAVTLYQPWASLIVDLIKYIETRDWSPPKYMIGKRLAIHAGKYRVRDLDSSLLESIINIYGHNWRINLPYGSVLGIVTLNSTGVVIDNDGINAYYRNSPNEALKSVPIDNYGDFDVGRHLWFLSDVQKFDKPIEARGHFKIWDWRLNV